MSRYPLRTKEQNRQLVIAAAQRNGVPVNVALAQIAQESSFNQNAVSSAGAAGLAQFMPATGRGMGLVVNADTDQRFDPELAADAFGRHMRQLMDLYDGDIEYALAAYNWGPKQALRQWKNADVDLKTLPTSPQGAYRAGTMPAQTSHYIRTIMGQAGGSSDAEGDRRRKPRRKQ